MIRYRPNTRTEPSWQIIRPDYRNVRIHVRSLFELQMRRSFPGFRKWLGTRKRHWQPQATNRWPHQNTTGENDVIFLGSELRSFTSIPNRREISKSRGAEIRSPTTQTTRSYLFLTRILNFDGSLVVVDSGAVTQCFLRLGIVVKGKSAHSNKEKSG